jgi:hypothetical protein
MIAKVKYLVSRLHLWVQVFRQFPKEAQMSASFLNYRCLIITCRVLSFEGSEQS